MRNEEKICKNNCFGVRRKRSWKRKEIGKHRARDACYLRVFYYFFSVLFLLRVAIYPANTKSSCNSSD